MTGIRALNYATGSTTIASTGTVTGTSTNGIFAYNASTTTDLTITVADVTGGQKGIRADNRGHGATIINTTAGTVTGTSNRGIDVGGGASTTSLSITSGSVSGGTDGIYAVHYGSGPVTIDTTAGQVTGGTGAGIGGIVWSSSGLLSITTGNVSGGRWGIYAQHYGAGAMTINSTQGTMTGGVFGIQADMFNNATNLTITTANVTGGQYGIRARNNGSGATTIDTTGGTVTTTVGGTTYTSGIIARNAASTTGLTITTADVAAVTTYTRSSGIRAFNDGVGSTTTIDTTRGTVTGGYDGIFARNGSNTGALTITTARVDAAQYGVRAANYGTGSTRITTGGSVTSRLGDGINAFNSSTANDLTITTAGAVTGFSTGIIANNYGRGLTTINTTLGSVSGTTYFHGIDALNTASATDLTITTANVTGAQIGIRARNNGTGATSITVAPGGVVQGSTAGISASHASASPFTITVNGEVRNSSGLGSDLAITAASTGAGLVLNNNSNTIIGTVNLTAASDTFNNVGSWYTENGTSDFGAGTDTLNNSGLIRAANNAALAETTRFNNLETFNHSGIVTLRDGAVGDRLITSGNFVGSGGEVRLDTVLDKGAGGSDILEIGGNASGSTRLRIANAGGTGGKTAGDGILVVQVNGTSTPNAFRLAAPVSVGIWNYQLDYGGANNTNQNWYLVSNGINEAGAVYESAPRLLLDALQSLPTLQQRIGQRQVFGESGQQGAWVRAIGEWRDANPQESTAGSHWRSATQTLQLGYDHVVGETESGTWALGVNGHYKRLDANVSNDVGRGSVDADAYGAGLTATWYGNSGAYVDLQAVFSRTVAVFASNSLGSLAKGRHGQGQTLSAEAGYRVGLDEQNTLIPQLQLQSTRLQQADFTDDRGNRVALGDQTNNLARLGLAWEMKSGANARFYAIGNLLHNFSPATEVTVNDVVLRGDYFANAGELGFGGSLALSGNTMFYGEGSYRINLDGGKDESYQVTAGVRVSW